MGEAVLQGGLLVEAELLPVPQVGLPVLTQVRVVAVVVAILVVPEEQPRTLIQ
ncbi:MAG: hypothetical protein WAW00_03830 [Candidatus Moraniibacteriota bacterium]